MIRSLLFGLIAFLAACTPATKEEETKVAEDQNSVYELRTYYAAEGKLENLLSRFRNHTTSLFEKHGMTNVAYWIPVENTENILVYLMSYPSKAARDSSWMDFRNDPEWQSVYQASRTDGALVDSVKNTFLSPTDFSPEMLIEDKGPRIFEMRTYTTNESRLAELHDRFRDHTMQLFENNGMVNIVYFDLLPEEADSDRKLLYFISHADTAAARSNWRSFLDDPEWQEVYQNSIVNGNLVRHIDSKFLVPVDFSPLK